VSDEVKLFVNSLVTLRVILMCFGH